MNNTVYRCHLFLPRLCSTFFTVMLIVVGQYVFFDPFLMSAVAALGRVLC